MLPEPVSTLLLTGDLLRGLRDSAGEFSDKRRPTSSVRDFDEEMKMIPDIRVLINLHPMLLARFCDRLVHGDDRFVESENASLSP